jgi:DNA-binding NtrC family response regulator
LPGLNGLETFQEIKKYNPGIRVVILTENHDVHVAQQFVHEGGVYEYLLKEKDSVMQISRIIDGLVVDHQKKGYVQNEERKKDKKLLRVLVGFVFAMTFLVIAFWFIQRYR